MCEMHSVPGGKTNSLKASCMFSPNFPLPSFFEKWYKRQLRTDRLAVKERLSDLLLTESPLFLSLCLSHSYICACSGKTVKDDSTKGEAEVKNATAEVKTVPNEAPQMNGNESKA